MKKVLIPGAIAALTLAQPATAAETIFTSNFEDEKLFEDGTRSGWKVVQSTVDGVWKAEQGTAGIELQFNNTAGAPAPNGGRVIVELDSHSNSGMFYTFAEDGIYTLDFLFSPRPGLPSGSNFISVLVKGVMGETVLGQFTGGPNPSTVWSSETVKPFTALKNQQLVFRAGGNSDGQGGYLDNIKLSNVSAVPEPGTWAMFILGLGLIGFAMRNRQKAAAISFA
jgi:hypothetical protein